jgi:DNA-binding NarL/FixJ family response regulator
VEEAAALLVQRYGLSERQALISAKVTRGATNTSVAAELALSHETVTEHLRRGCEKLRVKDRSELVSVAVTVFEALASNRILLRRNQPKVDEPNDHR